MVFAKYLKNELEDVGLKDVELDEHGARQVGDKVRLGLQGKCNDFIDDGGK